MNLRSKLLLSLCPLLAAIAVAVVAGGITSTALGRSSRRIFDENYRSVLAAQRMKDAAERLDRGALFAVIGWPEPAGEGSDGARRRFEEELGAEEANITESGEIEAARRLREAWAAYVVKGERFRALPAGTRAAYYFDELLPAFVAIRGAADAVLGVNQDAMVQKSALAERTADRFTWIILAVGLAGCALALAASALWMSRLLRPISVLGGTARRIGEGDFAARAVVSGGDEVAGLARELNTMAARLQRYRESSLGELLQAQQDLQAAIDSLPDPVLVVSLDGGLPHANRAAEVLLGVRKTEGPSWLAGLSPGLRAMLERVRAHVLSGKGGYAPRGLDEAVKVPAEQGERRLLPRASPVYDDEGTVVGTTLVLDDVTRLLREDELRSNLVATVAHEFRTPLTSIRMALHLCTEGAVGPLSPKQLDLLFAAREDCERLQTIVDELLDASRPQEGRPAAKRAPTPAEDLVRHAVEAHRAEAERAGVTLRAEALPGLGHVVADRERIQIVLSNLIANALHHSPPGAAVVARAAADGDAVRFEIADQGPGVAVEHRDAIFERFFQAPGGKAGSAGLGLAIAKEIVEEHEGAIGVESEPGAGARFWFRLPSAVRPEP